jgi:hypothetical protein
MSLYAIIKNTIVDNVAVADAPLDVGGEWICIDDVVPRPGVDWLYDNGQFSPPPPAPAPDKAAFRFRMTDSEYVGILSAAKTDIEVASWVETFNMVSTIDLDSQRTKDGVANLVSKNLLTQARADEILTAPVQPGELP